MSDVFLPNLQWKWLVGMLAHRQVGFAPVSLAEPFRLALVEEIGRQTFRRERSLAVAGIKLAYQTCKPAYPLDDQPCLQGLGQELKRCLHEASEALPNLRQWEPNDVTIQRYSRGTDGISAHRDYLSDLYVVAVFTVAGYGQFEVLNERRPDWVDTYQTGPGSLALLWSTDLTPGDHRPLHRMLGPIDGPRISVAYRMSTKL